jgi:hypothetical protein
MLASPISRGYSARNERSDSMKWVTREHGNIDRVACPWLIKRFIDQQAEFIFVPRGEVLDKAKELGAKSYDAKGADFSHEQTAEGEVCTFVTLMMHHDLWGKDPALDRVAKIVSTADVNPERSAYHEPEEAGLSAIAYGFALLSEDDHRKIAWETPMYDALYEWAKKKTAS